MREPGISFLMQKKQVSLGNGMGEGERQEFACWWRVLISFVGKGGLKLDLGPDFVRQLESRATCGTWGRGKPWGMVVSIWLVYLKEKATSAHICVRKEYTVPDRQMPDELLRWNLRARGKNSRKTLVDRLIHSFPLLRSFLMQKEGWCQL